MKPIGPLMREHRLIERMISVLAEKLRRASEVNSIDPGLIDTATDFLAMYADRTRHGKEEDILFRELAKKELAREHVATMNELIQEHRFARKTVSDLIEAKKSYFQGDLSAQKSLIMSMERLVELYPRHIEKEDKHFFYPAMDYLSQTEQANMPQEFWDFDREMIHKKYRKVVEGLGDGK